MPNVSFPRLVELDTVTGLPPRKIMDSDLPVLLRSMASLSLPMCAIMIDIDHFKKFNDTWGHDTGDIVLRHVSSLVRNCVRFRGEAYRYGGEEITVLLLNTGEAEGMATAERIRKLVEDSEITVVVKGKEIPLQVQISLGVASTEQVRGSELIVSADRALYEAKEGGRNNSVLYSTQSKGKSCQTTVIDVHFPERTSIIGGSYILLKKWFSNDSPMDIEAREIKDPGTDSVETAQGPTPSRGIIQAEIRGKVSAVRRYRGGTDFKLEVRSELIDVMYKYILDSSGD
ncbi:hypothetical protein CSA37_03005 [Candidatus Fermentibacteria bacterium]|nr:MAG: hypothetical protein CSA37_03005 [Candidatus Fermentibacteria bacterium]